MDSSENRTRLRLGWSFHQFIDNDVDNPVPSLPVDFFAELEFQPHPPGNVVTDQAGADALFRMWLQ